MAPSAINIVDPMSISLVCSFKSAKRLTLRWDHISKAAKYPKPPIIIKAIVLILNNTSPTIL